MMAPKSKATPKAKAPAKSKPAKDAAAAAEAVTETKAAPKDEAAENTLLLQLSTGLVTIKLRPDLAPQHVAQIKALAREGFYDGVVFHRVIPGFMAQGGDPTGTGGGGSDKPHLTAEV